MQELHEAARPLARAAGAARADDDDVVDAVAVLPDVLVRVASDDHADGIAPQERVNLLVPGDPGVSRLLAGVGRGAVAPDRTVEEDEDRVACELRRSLAAVLRREGGQVIRKPLALTRADGVGLVGPIRVEHDEVRRSFVEGVGVRIAPRHAAAPHLAVDVEGLRRHRVVVSGHRVERRGQRRDLAQVSLPLRVNQHGIVRVAVDQIAHLEDEIGVQQPRPRESCAGRSEASRTDCPRGRRSGPRPKEPVRARGVHSRPEPRCSQWLRERAESILSSCRDLGGVGNPALVRHTAGSG